MSELPLYRIALSAVLSTDGTTRPCRNPLVCPLLSFKGEEQSGRAGLYLLIVDVTV